MLDPLIVVERSSSCTWGDGIPGFANVEDIDTIWTSLPEVWFHVHLQILGSQVALSCEKHFNILRRGIEDWRKISWRHGDGLDIRSSRDICLRRFVEFSAFA